MVNNFTRPKLFLLFLPPYSLTTLFLTFLLIWILDKLHSWLTLNFVESFTWSSRNAQYCMLSIWNWIHITSASALCDLSVGHSLILRINDDLKSLIVRSVIYVFHSILIKPYNKNQSFQYLLNQIFCELRLYIDLFFRFLFISLSLAQPHLSPLVARCFC